MLFSSCKSVAPWYISGISFPLIDTVHANNILSLLDAEHSALGSIAAGADLAQALEHLLLALQDLAEGGAHACLVLIDEADRFCGLSAPSLPQDLCLALRHGGEQPSPFGTAAFSGAPVYCGDITRDVNWSAGRKEAMLHGYRACWVAPVFGAKGHILGVLGLFFQATCHPTQPEIELLALAARVAAHVIERGQLEQALHDSREHFHYAIELNTQVLWTADLDGKLDYVAQRWRDWTGGSGLGTSWLDAIHPEDVPRTLAAWSEAVGSGQPLDQEMRVRRQDGQYRWVHSRAYCRRDERGQAVKWYGSCEDIDEHWQARNALLDSEAQFRSLASTMPNQAWLAHGSGATYWVNEQVCEYTGQSMKSLVSSGFRHCVHPDDVQITQKSWDRAVATASAYEQEFRMRRASDGAYRWFLARALPLFDEAGKVLRWVGTNTDVQEQKNVLEKMAYLNSSLEVEMANRTADRDRMWRLSTDIMLVADLSGMIIAVNPAWSKILERPEIESLGMDFISLVHPDDRMAALQDLSRLAHGAPTLRMENRYRRRDGGYRWISWTAVPAQKLIHAIGRDVTDEKEARLALVRSEQALLQAQKLESIGKLTGGVAHDFNNVLQIISGNLQLLKLTVADNPQAARRLDSAASAVERGAKLSSQLLAFARRQPLKPLVTDLGRLLRRMHELIRRALGEAITEETFISEGLWHTLVDPNQMENVLLNMAINARDAMDKGGRLTFTLSNVTLDAAYASLHADVLEGQYVLLTITDTGHGMERDVIDQIFEPFFTTKKEGEGTGLGLSMAYGFIRQSAGHIKVHSAPGAGTTFKIYLPRSLEKLAEPPPGLTGPVLGGGETILVVEDDAPVQHTVVDMLRGLGYDVLHADDGASALALLGTGVAIDLLFTDVVMPGPVSSKELAQQARLLLPDLAVLFTSGYTHNAIMRGGRLDAGVELLSKPYRREDLARRIRHLLADRRLVGAPDPSGRRILLVEDNDDAREMTTEMLNMLGHTVHGVASAEAAMPLLAMPGLDVLVTDISLPTMSGLELARHARAHWPQLEVVFASGHDWGASLMQDASARFLRKPFGLEELASALKARRLDVY
ncbi:blue-light-activated protein [Janthinobacterium sp. HH103]|uniref:PAS domain-containing protein n=1 Tax=unclassified Janthinobacterium TaxID=2610881 RepID=UPI000893535F|nr:MULTISPECIES: PAS domain-containing protein [unclassified Janthinobacterium]OEZ72817.1 blue-light-activated protein [Janthinobacterium sp. HH100]OEZ86683.1 blue-light-activated protein [Janthinobacterium sp. HH103]QOU73789.1 Sensor histidine kinase RcsC [Janthinobacterium sp. HH102]